MTGRWYTLILFGILTGAPSSPALADESGMRCDDGFHHVSVSLYPGPDDNPAVVGIVFLREWLGVCRPAVFMPDEPFAVTPSPDYPVEMVTINASFEAPDPDVVFRYTPYAVHEDGSQALLRSLCVSDSRAYLLASCSDVPFLRGRLRYSWESSFYVVDPCTENCWIEGLWYPYLTESILEELSGLELADLMDVTLDFYGDRTGCPLPGDRPMTSVASRSCPVMAVDRYRIQKRHGEV